MPPLAAADNPFDFEPESAGTGVSPPVLSEASAAAAVEVG